MGRNRTSENKTKMTEKRNIRGRFAPDVPKLRLVSSSLVTLFLLLPFPLLPLPLLPGLSAFFRQDPSSLLRVVGSGRRFVGGRGGAAGGLRGRRRRRRCRRYNGRAERWRREGSGGDHDGGNGAAGWRTNRENVRKYTDHVKHLKILLDGHFLLEDSDSPCTFF